MIPAIAEYFGSESTWATLHQATISFEEMGERTITSQIRIDGNHVPDFSGWYVVFNGEKFVLNTIVPQAEKNDGTINSLADLTFVSYPIFEMQRYFFPEMSQVSAGTYIAGKYESPLTLNITDFVTAFNRVLSYYFKGSIVMTVVPGANLPTDVRTMDINYSYIWDVLKRIYDVYGVSWHIEHNATTDVYSIVVGGEPAEINHVFEYGYDGGLKRVERQAEDLEIYNELLGRGGEKNLPYRYFKLQDPNNTGWEADPDAIPELRNVPFDRLMDHNFRWYIRGWMHNPNRDTNGDEAWDPGHVFPTYSIDSSSPYYWAYQKGLTDTSFDPVEYVKDDESIAVYGIRHGKLDDNDDIYPTIQGLEVSPYGRIDETVAIGPITDGDDGEEVANWFQLDNIELGPATDIGLGIEIRGTETFTVNSGFVAALTYSWYFTPASGKPATTIDTDASYIQAERISDGQKFNINAIPAGGPYRLTGKVYLMGPYEEPAASRLTVHHIEYVETYPNYDNGYTFNVWVKNLWDTTQGSDESDVEYMKRVWEPILGDKLGNEAKLVFSSGWMSTSQDYEFTIVRWPQVDRSKSLNGVQSEWMLTLKKSDAELDATGLYIPNASGVKPVAGDTFFLTGIDMPHIYTEGAEKKLTDTKIDALADKAWANPTWSVELDKVRINTLEGQESVTLASLLDVGKAMQIRDKRLTNSQTLTFGVRSITYTWNEPSDENPYLYPDVEVMLSEKAISKTGSIEKITTEVRYIVAKDFVSSDQAQNLINRATRLVGGGTDLDTVWESLINNLDRPNTQINIAHIPDLFVGTTLVQGESAPQALTGITTLDASGLATIRGGLSLGGTFNNVDSKLVWDADNNAWHLIGNLYADGFITAGGVGSGGSGGGGIVDAIRRYSDLGGTFSDSNNDVFNAYTVNKINTDLSARIASLEGGSATSITTTGSGNVVTNISKSGTVITVTKGTTLGSLATLSSITTSYISNLESWIEEKGYVTSSGVTSVGLSVPTGLSVSGSPITSSGTLAITFASGYAIPTTAKQGEWDAKYAKPAGGIPASDLVMDSALALSKNPVTNAAVSQSTMFETGTGFGSIKSRTTYGVFGTVSGTVSGQGTSYSLSTSGGAPASTVLSVGDRVSLDETVSIADAPMVVSSSGYSKSFTTDKPLSSSAVSGATLYVSKKTNVYVSASGRFSFAVGDHTQALNPYESAFGYMNLSRLNSSTLGDAGNTRFSVGMGSGSMRRNAFEIMQSGDVYVYGIGGYDGTVVNDTISTLGEVINSKQPLDADLTAIAGLTGTSGFLKKTAANTWALTSIAFSDLSSHPTTLADYGITDAKIQNGVITLGNATITPLTQHQSLDDYVTLDTDQFIDGEKYFRSFVRFQDPVRFQSDADFWGNIGLYNNSGTRGVTLSYGLQRNADMLEVDGNFYVDGDSFFTGRVAADSILTDSYLRLTGGNGENRIYFGTGSNAPYLEYNSNGFHFSDGVYSDGFITAGGVGSGGSGGGGIDLDRVWESLTNNTDKPNITINPAHIPTLATTKVDGLESRLSDLEGGSATNIDFSGSGSVLTDVSKSGNTLTFTRGNVAFSSLTGKPTTISGFGITDAKFGTAGADYVPITLGSATKNVLTAHQSLANIYTKSETDSQIATAINALPSPMVFKGSLGTGGTATSLPAASSENEGWTYKVITAGTYQGVTVKVGDTIISNGSAWVPIPSGDEPSGTVTSVGLTVPTGLSVSGSPITTSGTLKITFASGYSLPTTAKQNAWDAKYDKPSTGIPLADLANSSLTVGNASISLGGSATLSQIGIPTWAQASSLAFASLPSLYIAKNAIRSTSAVQELTGLGNLIPDDGEVYNLGSSSKIWRSIYGGNLHINGIIANSSKITVWDKLDGDEWSIETNGTATFGNDIRIFRALNNSAAAGGAQKKLYFDGDSHSASSPYFEVVNIGTTASPVWAIHTNVGFYSDSFVTAGGVGAGGSGGGDVDLDRVWESLTNNTDKPNVKINVAHIPTSFWQNSDSASSSNYLVAMTTGSASDAAAADGSLYAMLNYYFPVS